MSKKRYTNDVLAGNNNGGLHSARKLNTLNQFFTTHDLKQAVLFQFILSGSDKAEYQATMKALLRHIRTKCRAEYIGAYEVGVEKGGLHCHAFVIIETAKHFPADLLDVSEGKFIARRIKRKAKAKVNESDKSLSIRIESPKNPMHGGAMFARMNTPEKLADAIKWATYFLKVRSKDGVQGRETYFGSEFASNIAKREAVRQKYRDALTKSTKSERPRPAPAQPQAECLEQAATTNIEQGDNDMNMTNLTPAGFRYLAGLYESCIDAGMDVGAIYAHLTRKGVSVTRAEVIHHLDHVFKFHGYAATHPAKPVLTFAQADAEMRRPARRAVAVGSELGRTDPPLKHTETGVQKILDKNYGPVHN